MKELASLLSMSGWLNTLVRGLVTSGGEEAGSHESFYMASFRSIFFFMCPTTSSIDMLLATMILPLNKTK